MGILDLIFLGLALFIVRTRALRCYTCSYQFSGTSRDKECVDSPWNVTQGQKSIKCPYSYCVVFRQALKATNTIHSFHRGCEMKGRGNDCVHDSYYSTCSYTCDTDFCNGGDGVPVGDQVGQDVVHTKTVVNPRPRPRPNKNQTPRTPKPPGTRYDYNTIGNMKGMEEIEMDRENEGTGIPRKEKTRKNEKKMERKEREKNERRKGDCRHPYACDQSKYSFENSGISLSSHSVFYIHSLVLAITAYLYS